MSAIGATTNLLANIGYAQILQLCLCLKRINILVFTGTAADIRLLYSLASLDAEAPFYTASATIRVSSNLWRLRRPSGMTTNEGTWPVELIPGSPSAIWPAGWPRAFAQTTYESGVDVAPQLPNSLAICQIA